ncbi:hypothetical protein PHYSODRAFT_313481 [Phytophthora sojae]|uniref:Uncharacterized protein n=1 Tax=Phytophthora sojae (strain P6497) TaxID=1094619 RepID=G4Z972_PHYSP|nr:hypothetical protein PHYSODRAFT_313481 [Phytophthora sojae]EGZ21126.1 hypothetical protein PHYSODRAFT_313481 [Phytophthora sojae]|eukprot:XP_009523843.1 hypothetical protein PHYSODRAFT_313481 [Phytophthora sojae]
MLLELRQLNKYLPTIQVDEEHPGFLFDWQVDNVTAFVAAANSLDPAQAPQWLRTRPPLMTCSSFINDLVAVLEPLAGGRCGHSSVFLQDAAQLALPVANDVEKHLVEAHYLVETRAQRYQANHLPPDHVDGQHPLRRIFI